MDDRPVPGSQARSIKPGDPDHPGEQVKRAGRGRPAPTGSAVYHVRVVVTGDEEQIRSPLDAPSIAAVERAITDGIRQAFPKLQARAEATRTDI